MVKDKCWGSIPVSFRSETRQLGGEVTSPPSGRGVGGARGFLLKLAGEAVSPDFRT